MGGAVTALLAIGLWVLGFGVLAIASTFVGGGLRALASRIEKLERESEELKTMGIRLAGRQHMTNAKSELPGKEAQP